jgi:predicted secreted Zn-dependent protease
MTLPDWSGYSSATPAQKQSWDNMITALRQHEQEHVNIAYRNAQKLVKTLTNLPVDQAAQKVADSQQAGQDAQDDFDSTSKTDHGKNQWGAFPKVELDVSADPPPPPPPPPPKTK